MCICATVLVWKNYRIMSKKMSVGMSECESKGDYKQGYDHE